MKKLTIILSLFIIALCSKGTNVTGGIYSNTTWTLANSPYIVSDTVMVFPGVTLTIQPGVVVKFNSKGLLESRGVFYAQGTSSDSIIFTSNSTTPMAGDYNGIYLATSTAAITYCRISYASKGLEAQQLDSVLAHCVFSSDIDGITEISISPVDTCTFIYDTTGINEDIEAPIEGCTFLYNGTAVTMNGGIYSPIENSLIEYNNNGLLIRNNNSIMNCIIAYNKDYGVTDEGGTISYNEIEYNGIGINSSTGSISYNNISNNYIGIETNGALFTYDSNTSTQEGIYCNSFCHNTDYNLVTLNSGDFSVKDNYWCLNDSAQIQATIYDGYQKLTLGLAFFTPFYDSACNGTPNAINELKSVTNPVKVYPNPNNGSFTVSILNINTKCSMEIYNVLGESIYNTTLNSDNTGINIKGQPSGVYFYRILKESWGLVGSGKVIIEK
jgi:hypothetical protein